MTQRLKFFLLYAVFWMVFLITIRAVFLSYNYDFSKHLSATDFLLVFWNGLRMDMSMAGYFMALTGLVLILSVFIRATSSARILQIITLLLLFLSSLLVIADMELYRHWGFRINTTPFFYIGAEAAGSVSTGMIIRLSVIFLILFLLFTWVYVKFLHPRAMAFSPAPKKTAVVLLMLSAFMFIPIRGSFTVAPMNTGFVYFHKTNAFANHAAINVIWNFLYSVRKGARTEYPDNFFDAQKTETLFKTLYPTQDSTTHVFNTSRPNVILFVVESFTADVIGPLGGMADICPNLNALCREGILFDNFYASGDRTDKGIISVLSGYPAQPATSIIKYPDKTRSLPYLTHIMRDLGYTTSFVYGGDVDFANFRSYLTACNFDHMTTEEDFDRDINESKWGVHDHFVLDRAFAECDSARSPFFKTILTLSSHEPFDVPMEKFIKGDDEQSLFLNACHYTDKSIGAFINKAKQQPWWKNTVVLFVADHGHRLPYNKEIKDKERFRIPLLMMGGAISKDTVIHTYGSQTDIANTLLAQLDTARTSFMFSKNLLGDHTMSFANYYFSNGYGMVGPGKYMIYDNEGKQFLRTDNASKEDLDISKAYQQKLYTDYNQRGVIIQ